MNEKVSIEEGVELIQGFLELTNNGETGPAEMQAVMNQLPETLLDLFKIIIESLRNASKNMVERAMLCIAKAKISDTDTEVNEAVFELFNVVAGLGVNPMTVVAVTRTLGIKVNHGDLLKRHSQELFKHLKQKGLPPELEELINRLMKD